MITHEIRIERHGQEIVCGEIGVERIEVFECKANVMVSVEMDNDERMDFIQDLTELVEKYSV